MTKKDNEQSTAKILTKAEIFASSDLKSEKVDMPEWGGAVYVRPMTGDERDRWEDYCVSMQNKSSAGIMQLLVSMTVVDEAGENIFTKDDIADLGKKSAAAISRLFVVSRNLSAITKYDLENLAKN